MADKTLKILLGIIAVNLTIQTVKDVGFFPTAYAQNNTVQRVAICDPDISSRCVNLMRNEIGIQRLAVTDVPSTYD